MKTYSLYDLKGIQAFTFGARRLQANLGASWLAYIALSPEQDGWLGELVKEVGSKVCWSGGGNAVVESPTLETARLLATKLSIRVLEEAPGLAFFCEHLEGNYNEVEQNLQHAIARKKASWFGEARFDGGGVCESCRDSAEPAVVFDKDGQPTSISIQKREEAQQKATKRLTAVFDPKPYTWSSQMDELGRSKGEESSVGIIHIDGNGLGKHFAQTAKQGLDALRELSNKINQGGLATLKAGLQWVCKKIEAQCIDFELCTNNQGEKVFPVRPVIFGGDDITLLCDGRLALDLAAEMLQEWHRQSGFHACAGIALVRSHYPFHRAVRHAEELCREAKNWRKKNLPAAKDASLIHWSLQRTGSLSHPKEQATARPYLVVGDQIVERPWRSWEWFRLDCLKKLQQQHKEQEKHTQLKGLATALVGGAEEARRFLSRLADRHNFFLPTPEHHTLNISGFLQHETPYLDALELLDFIPAELP